MLHFWLDVIGRAVTDTLSLIGKDPADIRFSIIVFVFITLLLVAQDAMQNGWQTLRTWQTMKARITAIFGKELKIVVIICALIFVCYFFKEPYSIWASQYRAYAEGQSQLRLEETNLSDCSGNLKTEAAKSGLLASQVLTQQQLINSQQRTFNSQQGTFDAQQQTVNSCVVALGQVNTQPQHFTLVMDQIALNPKWKHNVELIAFTNKDISPRVRVQCDNEIGDVSSRVAGAGFTFGQSNKLMPNLWMVNLQSPLVTATSPLMMILSYDEDDLGKCVVARQ
jgi:hypothetical protein